MAQNEMAARRVPGRPREEARGESGLDVNVGQMERAASVVAGGALAAYGLSKRNPAGLGLALLGGALMVRGSTGHCPVYQAAGTSTAPAEETVHLEHAVIVNQPRTVLYQFWREFANLPEFVPGLESVVPVGDTQLHWTASGPRGERVTWDSEIIAEKKNALVTWRTAPQSPVRHTISVRFTSVPHGRGTEVRLSLEFRSPGGKITGDLARLFGKVPEEMIQETLRRFKQLMEAGEIATTHGQPKGA